MYIDSQELKLKEIKEKKSSIPWIPLWPEVVFSKDVNDLYWDNTDKALSIETGTSKWVFMRYPWDRHDLPHFKEEETDALWG